MLKSMTGFGRASHVTDACSLAVEIRALNARFLDIDISLPSLFSDREHIVRSLITEHLQRGKISAKISYTPLKTVGALPHYDEATFKTHYAQLKKLADSVMAPYDALFQWALHASRIEPPSDAQRADAAAWEEVEKYMLQALERCDTFRQREGRVLQAQLRTCATVITKQLAEVEDTSATRRKKIENRVKEKVAIHLSGLEMDSSRIEQEILFYTERMAIDEEKARLAAHLDLFMSALDHATSDGKKLGFIAQEIGREINTIGSKANDIKLQKCVIAMKEELEKIKEQLYNIL